MADNVPVTPGVGADVATDDVGGVHFQKIKVDLGGDGASIPLVAGAQAAAASLPVALASDQLGTGLSQEETLQGILLLLSQILEKLPRIDANDRVLFTTDNAPIVQLQNGLIGDVTRLANFGPNAVGYNMSASYFMHHAANSGASHIYNQITVS